MPVDQLIEFMAEKTKKYPLKDQGYFYDVVNAILCDVGFKYYPDS